MNPAKRICLRPSRHLLHPARSSAPHAPHGPAPFRAFTNFTHPPSSRCHPSPPWVQSSPVFCRHQSSSSSSQPVAASASSDQQPERKSWRAAPHRRPDEPVYELYFTCKVCKHRSGHSISKQAYHKGTTLVQCPGCSNRHLISDHLKIFSDKGVTLEDILRDKGESLRLGGIDGQGDLEFWDAEAANDAEESAERAERSNS